MPIKNRTRIAEVIKIISVGNIYSEATIRFIAKRLFETIGDQLRNGMSVSVKGFGTFRVRKTANRSYTMPEGSRVTSGDRLKVTFVPGASLYEGNKTRGVDLVQGKPKG